MRDVVMDSGTSFYWGMRLLPAVKRKAMYAIYAFCREVDDVADGDAPVAAKLDELAGWRREVDALFKGRPSRPTTFALTGPVARFDLPAAEFHAMIDGMEMDAGDRMRAPRMDELIRYCRCVAGVQLSVTRSSTAVLTTSWRASMNFASSSCCFSATSRSTLLTARASCRS